MPMNYVQLQSGLSLPAFIEKFGTETQCELALEAARRLDDFCCPGCCKEAGHSEFRVGARKMFPVQGLSDPNFNNRRYLVSENSFTAYHMVPGHLPDQPGQNQHLVTRPEAPVGGQLSYCLIDRTQTHASDGRTRSSVYPERQCSGGRCLSWRRTNRRQGWTLF